MHNINIEKCVFEEIVKHYGKEAQTNKLIEELSECVSAISRYRNDLSMKNRNELIFEIADSLITLSQSEFIFDIAEEEITEAIKYKIDRTQQRIIKENFEKL